MTILAGPNIVVRPGINGPTKNQNSRKKSKSKLKPDWSKLFSCFFGSIKFKLRFSGNFILHGPLIPSLNMDMTEHCFLFCQCYDTSTGILRSLPLPPPRSIPDVINRNPTATTNARTLPKPQDPHEYRAPQLANNALW